MESHILKLFRARLASCGPLRGVWNSLAYFKLAKNQIFSPLRYAAGLLALAALLAVPLMVEAQTEPNITVSFEKTSFFFDEDIRLNGISVKANTTSNGTPTQDITVTFQFTDGTATEGDDYIRGSGTLTINASGFEENGNRYTPTREALDVAT